MYRLPGDVRLVNNRGVIIGGYRLNTRPAKVAYGIRRIGGLSFVGGRICPSKHRGLMLSTYGGYIVRNGGFGDCCGNVLILGNGSGAIGGGVF